MAEHKKKRAYAAQAYEFGANAVPAAGGAPAPLVPGVGMGQGMPAVDNLAGQFGQMNMGAPQPVGYQQPGYQQPGYQAPGLQQPVQVQPQAPAAAAHLNQLFPSDLMQQVGLTMNHPMCMSVADDNCSRSMSLSWINRPRRSTYLQMLVAP
jgi:protein transport protein SEC24